MKGIIYSYESPIGKYYIGQTKHEKTRKSAHKKNAERDFNTHFYRAIRKYGFDNFKYKVLEKVDVEKLDEREMYYIEKYNSFKEGYNSTLGGNGSKGTFGELNPFYNKTHTKETKKLISKLHKGKKLSEEHKLKIAESTKKALANLSEEKKAKMTAHSGNNKKSVYCISDNKIFLSLAEASEYYNSTRSDIRSCCNKKRITSKGKNFCWVEDKEIYSIKKNLSSKKILCIENKIIYNSISEAGRLLEINQQNISAMLRGKQKTVKGYTFKYLQDNTVPSLE